jgi:dTDP-4-dehydrorhamnose reductase
VRLLVTGRDGQLVRSLVERAGGRSDLKLVCAGRPETDLAVSGSIAEAIRAAAPDVVINAAAYTAVDQAEDEPELAFRINAEAAGEAAAAARDAGVPIIQLSTDYVFDGRGEGPYREDAPTHPIGVYGRSKLVGEEAVRAATPDHLILRTAWVYSPFGRNFVKTIMGAARERDMLKVVDDQIGSPTSAFDLADGLLALIDRWQGGDRAGLGQTYHLAGSGSTSWCGLARQVMAEYRRRGLPAAEVQPISTEDWPTRAERPRNSVLDSGRFERDFGFRMPDWRASVAAVVARLAERGADG